MVHCVHTVPSAAHFARGAAPGDNQRRHVTQRIGSRQVVGVWPDEPQARQNCSPAGFAEATLREREGSNTVIALVDPPDMVGAERDIPVFNWGFDRVFGLPASACAAEPAA